MPNLGLKENSSLRLSEAKTPPTLSREVSLGQRVVLVDGITRTGKSMLGPILASFKRVEIERVEEIFEYVGSLHRMGKIDRDAAVVLLRMEADMFLYNNRIGRNTNFRWTDHSSVWKNPHPMKYIRRLFAPEGNAALEAISRERPIYLSQTHDQLANFNLFLEAFGEGLRMVEMVRHPVDLFDSWRRRGWGERFGKDPRALTFCVPCQGQEVPYYALGWEELYLAITPLGRIVRMISSLWKENQRVYEGLADQEKRQILLIPFEPFAQNPGPYLEKMATSLGTRQTRQSRIAVKHERCPRSFSIEDRRRKRASLEEGLNSEEREIFQGLIEEYEALVEREGRGE